MNEERTLDAEAPPPAALILCATADEKSCTQVVTFVNGSFVVNDSSGERQYPVDAIVDGVFDAVAASDAAAQCFVAVGLEHGTMRELFSFAAVRGQWIDATYDGDTRSCTAQDVRQELLGNLVTLMRTSDATSQREEVAL